MTFAVRGGAVPVAGVALAVAEGVVAVVDVVHDQRQRRKHAEGEVVADQADKETNGSCFIWG